MRIAEESLIELGSSFESPQFDRGFANEFSRASGSLYPTLVGVGRALVARTQTLYAAGRGPARRVICVYVDGQAHDPVKRAPALVASWCAITRARSLLARRNVSLGRRLIAASPPKRAAVKKMSAAR
jgi:hypothetical protein